MPRWTCKLNQVNLVVAERSHPFLHTKPHPCPRRQGHSPSRCRGSMSCRPSRCSKISTATPTTPTHGLHTSRPDAPFSRSTGRVNGDMPGRLSHFSAGKATTSQDVSRLMLECCHQWSWVVISSTFWHFFPRKIYRVLQNVFFLMHH